MAMLANLLNPFDLNGFLPQGKTMFSFPTALLVGRHGVVFRDIGRRAVAAAERGRAISRGVELRREWRLQRRSHETLLDLRALPFAGQHRSCRRSRCNAFNFGFNRVELRSGGMIYRDFEYCGMKAFLKPSDIGTF